MELLVALPLALLAAAAAAMLLARVARTARTQSAALSVSRELRHARLVLSADLEPLGGTELIEVTDSLITLRAQLGVALQCATPVPDAIDVAVPSASDDGWMTAVRRGDLLQLWHADAAPMAAPTAALHLVAAPPSALGTLRCGADSTTQRRRWRIQLQDSVARPLHAAPVSVHRLVRYRHYRSADGWWLGRQAWDGVQWDGVQPVAGPLLPPAIGGVRVSARGRDGSVITLAPATADSARREVASLRVVLRMKRAAHESWAPVADSVEVLLPLRGGTRRGGP